MILLSISCLLPWRKRWDSVRSKRFESEYTAYYHSSSVLSVFIIILAGKILHPAVICSTTIWRLLPPLQFPFTFLYCASISWDQNATRRWAWIFFAFLFFFFYFVPAEFVYIVLSCCTGSEKPEPLSIGMGLIDQAVISILSFTVNECLHAWPS